jgi:hypothetical protein
MTGHDMVVEIMQGRQLDLARKLAAARIHEEQLQNDLDFAAESVKSLEQYWAAATDWLDENNAETIIL